MITAVAGPDRLILRGHRLPVAEDGRHVDEFEVHAGEEMTFSTTWVPSHHPLPEPLEYESRIEETIATSEAWAAQCTYEGPYRDHVVRSLVTLRLLTHGGTGGIVAAVTTSLPEDLGGERNWDYRFCWLRDASLTLEALLESGYDEEALLWRSWLLRAAAGDPQDLQIMYAVDGGRDLRGAHARPPPGLRRLLAGAGRERRGAPAADRRARRGDDRPGDGPRRRRARTTRTPGRCSGSWSRSWPGTGTSRTTGCGRSAVRSGSSRTPG